MKNLTILFTICIACIACHKRNDGHLAPNLNSRFTFDSLSFADFNGYSTQLSAFPLSSVAFVPNGKVNECLNLIGNANLECYENLFKNYKTEYEHVHEYSVSFWFKINDISGSDAMNIFESRIKNNGVESLDFRILLDNDSLFIGHLDEGSFPIPFATKSFAFNKFDWNNIAVVVGNNTYSVYLNGIETYNGNRNMNPTPYLYRLILGNYNSNTSNLYMYLDDLNVWNYTILGTDVTNYYNSTK